MCGLSRVRVTSSVENLSNRSKLPTPISRGQRCQITTAKPKQFQITVVRGRLRE